MWDTECTECFVKISQGIQELMGGDNTHKMVISEASPSVFREVVQKQG
jgi:hypothetical protein